MPTLGEELQAVALELQASVAPNVGDSIIEIWRPRGGVIPGGAGVNEYGEPVSSGSGSAIAAGTGLAFNDVYYGRFTHNETGGEPNIIGPTVSVLPFNFMFNAADEPDILGHDVMLIAEKRSVSQTIEELGWLSQHAYAAGAREQPTANSEFMAIATTGGVSGEVEPAWPHQEGATVADGTVIWTIHRKRRFEVLDPGGKETVNVEYVVGAQEIK